MKSQVIQFIHKVIRIRQRIINCSQRNHALLSETITKMKSVAAINYTDEGAAKVLLKYENEIRLLIPGNKAGDSIEKEFSILKNNCIKTITL